MAWQLFHGWHIFGSVHRLAKPLVFLLVAAQLLLAAPAMASARLAPGEAAKLPCAGMQMADSHHCPCCPDGVESMRDCLAACLLGVAATPTASVARIVIASSVVNVEPARLTETSSDPPLKPPPIR